MAHVFHVFSWCPSSERPCTYQLLLPFVNMRGATSKSAEQVDGCLEENLTNMMVSRGWLLGRSGSKPNASLMNVRDSRLLVATPSAQSWKHGLWPEPRTSRMQADAFLQSPLGCQPPLFALQLQRSLWVFPRIHDKDHSF